MRKLRIIKRTRKRHICSSCKNAIQVESTCTYVVVTNTDAATANGIRYGYFCTKCRDIQNNENTVGGNIDGKDRN